MAESNTQQRLNWSLIEVNETIETYFRMLNAELHGEKYVKSRLNEALSRKLNNRTRAAIEMKHQNISAVLTSFGLPYIDGYKPLPNVQALLKEEVARAFESNSQLKSKTHNYAIEPVVAPHFDDILQALQEAPQLKVDPGYSGIEANDGYSFARITNYSDLESLNRSLGIAGEEFVMNYERARLVLSGNDRLASKVDHVSQTKGDGLGYDILSFETNGQERLIEVKTTKFGEYMPFHLSINELTLSRRERERYQLYRVFNFRQSPKFFRLIGSIDSVANLEAIQFRGRLR